MSSLAVELPDLYEIEAQNSPLMGNRTAVFLTEEERFWLRQEKVTPPPQFGNFVGRADEMATLSNAIARRAPVITISGTAGVGKTALVQRLLGTYPSISHVSVSDFNEPWPAVASALVATYGRIPTNIRLPADEFRTLNPRSNPMVIVFDDLDRFGAPRRARKQLLRVMEKLSPALGDWLTVIIVSRDASSYANESIASSATAIDLQPLSSEARHAFLASSARDVGVELEPETSHAIADSSLGLPLILKSFLARSIDRMTSAGTKGKETVGLASFTGAIPDSFSDLALAYDSHLLAIEKLNALDWPVVQTLANEDVFNKVNVDQLQELATLNMRCSSRELGRSLRRLKARDIITEAKAANGLYVQSHIFFAFIRATQWMERHAEAGSNSFGILAGAAKKARAAARS
ncbi:MAG TPA: ATP-binding protein [Chthoniobacterales bacterium]|nr:ATP-binding protein [Chthoniobacterales bacterium]